MSKPGQVGGEDAGGGADEHRREGGPPRKLPSEMPQARPLKAITSSSAEIDQVPASAVSPGSASWPEKRTSSTPLPLVAWKASASRATATAGGGQDQEGLAAAHAVGEQPEPHHPEADDRDREGQRDRPEEVGQRRHREGGKRQRAERVGAGAQPGDRSHPDRDQRADPGGEQAGEQDQRQFLRGRGRAPRAAARRR